MSTYCAVVIAYRNSQYLSNFPSLVIVEEKSDTILVSIAKEYIILVSTFTQHVYDFN